MMYFNGKELTEFMNVVEQAKEELVKEMFEKLYSLLEVDGTGEAKIDVRKLHELENEYRLDMIVRKIMAFLEKKVRLERGNRK